MQAVEVDDVTVVLEKDGVSRIVDSVSLSLAAGEVMGIVGESGSGKSTLALALLGFTRPGARIVGGRVRIDGVDLLGLPEGELRRARRDLVSYVAQDPATALNPGLRLRTQLTEVLGGATAEALGRVREVLASVGLPADDAFLRRYPRQLSGGQQQRIAIAMAVVAGPRLIVLDEPTTGLDVSTQAKVLALVKRLCVDNRMAAIYVSHDLAVVGEVADRVSVMYGGVVVETGPTVRVLRRPAHPYSDALLGAVPSADERHRLIPIRGRAPGVGEAAPGCVFAARCDLATAACSEAPPGIVDVAGGGQVRCIHPITADGTARARVADVRAAPVTAASALSVRNLSACYGPTTVLHGIDLDLTTGECLAIVGESGSGKTTLSRCLIGLHERVSGEITLGGVALPLQAADRGALARQQLQYVFQNPFGSLNPRHTVGASLRLPLAHFFGVHGGDARARVAQALERVELPARLVDAYPADLSGGQRQRVAIARALVADPRVLICDEVTSALDVSVQASVVELLRLLLDDGLSMVFVTHNLAVVRSIADSVVVVREGRIVESGATAAVLGTPEHAYTRGLLADTLDVPDRRLAS